jgi:hypothetical protein
MPESPGLIVQIPRGGALDRQLRDDPPGAVASGAVVIEHGPTDEHGALEAAGAGEPVLSFASPEALRREPEAAHEAIAQAGTGTEPLVVVIGEAESLTDAELSPLLAAAAHTSRPVIVRIIRS